MSIRPSTVIVIASIDEVLVGATGAREVAAAEGGARAGVAGLFVTGAVTWRSPRSWAAGVELAATR